MQQPVAKTRVSSFGLYDSMIYGLLLLSVLATLVPLLLVLGGSFASTKELLQKGVVLFPTEFSLDGYRYLFSTPTFAKSLLVTVWITVLGTIFNLLFTILTAYPLSKTELRGHKAFMLLIVFSMIFSGGMIPTYLVVQSFGMLDTYWSLIIPGAISGLT
jgi:putative aldouronate transport system permease protein